MRAAIIGATVDDPVELQKIVRASARITHTDPKAEQGGFAVALATQMAAAGDVVAGDEFVERLQHDLASEGSEIVSLLQRVVESVERGKSTLEFAQSHGLEKGVTGYIFDSVPIAIHAWLSHQRDFRAAITEVVACGGDTDSTAAIVGGIVGAHVGKAGIPREWLDRLWEWPCSVSWMEGLARQLAATMQAGQATNPMSLPFCGVLPRNLLFLIVVLLHGFRRLLPPY